MERDPLDHIEVEGVDDLLDLRVTGGLVRVVLEALVLVADHARVGLGGQRLDLLERLGELRAAHGAGQRLDLDHPVVLQLAQQGRAALFAHLVHHPADGAAGDELVVGALRDQRQVGLLLLTAQHRQLGLLLELELPGEQRIRGPLALRARVDHEGLVLLELVAGPGLAILVHVQPLAHDPQVLLAATDRQRAGQYDHQT